MFLHDYGAPIGFRIIVAHPDQLHALIIQNGNIYKVGLRANWAKVAKFWADPKAHPEVLNAFLSFDATKERHIAGTSRPDRYDPDSWIDEYAHLSRPGQREIQRDLLYDYRTNVASYPKWQAWLRDHRADAWLPVVFARVRHAHSLARDQIPCDRSELSRLWPERRTVAS